MKLPKLKGDFSGKTIILRVDINSPIKSKKVLNNERISEAVESINLLKRMKAKIIVLAHQGRKGKSDFLSLEQHAKLINKKTKIKFVKDIFGKKATSEVGKMKNGDAILLENVRSLKEETSYSQTPEFVKKLSELSDVYVNDAFAVSHRKQASVVLFPRYLPSYLGKNFVNEAEALEKLKLKNALYILGGAKAEDNLKLLEKNKKSKVLACGLFGELCLIARGYKLGTKDKFFKDQKKNISRIKKFSNIMNPIDLSVKVGNKRKEISIEELPSKHMIYDVGSKTIKIFSEEIKKAKVVFMKGPAGMYEKKGFEKGTKEILKAIYKSKAFSVLGGGHLSSALKEININKKKFNHVSLSGGAFMSYVSGEKLPGLEAILKCKVKK